MNYFASEKCDASVQCYDDIYQKTILKSFAMNCQWCGPTLTKYKAKSKSKLNFTVCSGGHPVFGTGTSGN